MYQKAIELEPDKSSHHKDLASLYKEQKRYQEAIGEYKKALQLTDQEWERKNILREMLKVYEKTGRLNELAQELERKLKDVEKGEVK